MKTGNEKAASEQLAAAAVAPEGAALNYPHDSTNGRQSQEAAQFTQDEWLQIAFNHHLMVLGDLELGLDDSVITLGLNHFKRARTNLTPQFCQLLAVMIAQEAAHHSDGIRAKIPELFQIENHFEDATLAELAELAGLSPYGSTWEDIKGLLGQMTWAWPRWLPNGLLTMLVAHQEAGKSILALRIAACFLRGDPWPDGTSFTGEQGHVLWVETEAGQGLNLERAEKWGLPLNRILTVFDAAPLEDINLDEPEHQQKISEKAKMAVVRLVVVDSLSGGNRRDENGNLMMQTTKWLGELARDTQKPILLTHHLRKPTFFDGDKPHLHMVRGHGAITQVARVVWSIDQPDPMDTEQRRVSMLKYNIGRRPDPLGMLINDTGVTFSLEAPEAPKTETQLDKAIDMLLAMLADEPILSTEIEEVAKGAAISWRTMMRAKKKLGIVDKRERVGEHEDGRPKMGVKWGLPTKDLPEYLQ